MGSNILILVSAVLILAGWIGAGMKTVSKRLFFAAVSSVGMVMMSFATNNAYGFIAGGSQIVFQMVSLLVFIILLLTVLKKNEISKVEELNGIGKQMPYVFAMLTFFAAMIVGIPATGSFNGIFYSEIGLLTGGFGYVTYVGLLANAIGMIALAMLLLPILRQAYFPGAEAEKMKQVVKPGKAICVISFIVMLVLLVFSFYPKPILLHIGGFFTKIFS